MIEIFRDVRVNWLGKRKIYLAISGSVMLLGLISLVAKHGFRYGVDFKGGTVVQVRFHENPDIEKIRQLLRENGAPDSQPQQLAGRNDVLIGFRFDSWIYGAAAVFAAFHDTLLTLGLFSIFNREINLTVIAALLTLVGYSMNDTIVVFDRIRENLKLRRREALEIIMNDSINQTLSRTILTSG